METKELFLRAHALSPLDARQFLDRLADSLRMLASRYPPALLSGGAELTIPETMDEKTNADPVYFQAILRGIIYGGSGSAADRALFLEEADAAYISLWRAAAAGKRITRTTAAGGDD